MIGDLLKAFERKAGHNINCLKHRLLPHLVSVLVNFHVVKKSMLQVRVHHTNLIEMTFAHFTNSRIILCLYCI